MSMTRADYESLASAIHEVDIPLEQKRSVALEIATALCATNDRFDPARFLQQCDLGISEDDIATYSHALFLRTQTGVGYARKHFV
jgi:hypothetical protein